MGYLLSVVASAVVGFFIGTSPKNGLHLALLATVLAVALGALMSVPIIVFFPDALAVFTIQPALSLWVGYGIGILIKRAAQRTAR